LNKEDRIRDEVEKTLSVLDRIKNIEGNPFMYTRIKAGLESRPEIRRSPAFGMGLKVLPVILFLVLFSVNIISVLYYLNGKSSTINREKCISSFAKEYNISTSYNYIKDINIED
jgi:hypothetical protein